MQRTLALFAFLAAGLLSANRPIREVTSQAVLVAPPTPAFYKGYLYFVDQSRITLYAPEGHIVIAFDTQVGKPSAPHIMSLAVDTDQTIAVSWRLIKENKAGIDFFDSSGRNLRSIDTGRFLAAHLTYSDDRALWTFGWQRSAERPESYDPSDYMTVRRYSSTGHETGAFLPRSLFPKGLVPGAENWQEMRIQNSRDRIGLLAYSGDASNIQWVELDLNGNLLGKWPLVRLGPAGVAFTSDDHMYTQKYPKRTSIPIGFTNSTERQAFGTSSIGSNPAVFTEPMARTSSSPEGNPVQCT
jgi:hypothetical protein